MKRRRIVVAIDGSESSWRALDEAARLGAAMSLPLELVTVIDLGQLEFMDTVHLKDGQLEAWQERVRSETLHLAAGRVDDAVEVTTTLLSGPVVKTLLDHVAPDEVVMLVVGRHGKGALERLFMGSVSTALSHRGDVSVLVVP